MLAAHIHQFGAPATLKIENLSQPTLEAEEILVQVLATGTNPSDVKNVAGKISCDLSPQFNLSLVYLPTGAA